MKTELSLVIRVNAVATSETSKLEIMDLVKKLRQAADRMANEPHVTAINLDYTTNWEDRITPTV